MFPEEIAAITTILKHASRPCLVELGAQNGEDTDWMVNAVAKMQGHRIVSVEADIGNYDKLVGRNLPITAVYGAIADHDGECGFWENHDLGWGYGSIYEPLPGNSVNYAMFKKTGPIPCFTFNTLYREQKLEKIDLLCVDIHGAEKDMIRHGDEALRNTRYLFVEFMDTPTYTGMATKGELRELLPNWVMKQEFPWNMLLENKNP